MDTSWPACWTGHSHRVSPLHPHPPGLHVHCHQPWVSKSKADLVIPLQKTMQELAVTLKTYRGWHDIRAQLPTKSHRVLSLWRLTALLKGAGQAEAPVCLSVRGTTSPPRPHLLWFLLGAQSCPRDHRPPVRNLALFVFTCAQYHQFGNSEAALVVPG